LLAVDIDARRMRQVQASLERLGLAGANVQLLAADASDASFAAGRRFDAILLDAPCSATGIIRRQPDIKWHRRAADIPKLVALQARLLDSMWSLLKPGGRLLYATCSVLKEENARQVDAFLARSAGARALPLESRFGRASGPGRQRLPGELGMDGFYYALVGRDG
jgi:16S rRNA (cytosine967-C5)-methyltransferase